jgi:hypothetical protein
MQNKKSVALATLFLFVYLDLVTFYGTFFGCVARLEGIE